MLSRALFLAAVAFALGCFRAIRRQRRTLMKRPPSQIFPAPARCATRVRVDCSKASRPDRCRASCVSTTQPAPMAASMSAHVLSNGAANAAPGGGNLTRQGQEAAGARPGQGRGRSMPRAASRRPARPPARASILRRKPNARSGGGRRAARQAAREAAKAAKGRTPPKNEARHQPPKSDQPAEAAKPDAKPEADKAEPSKESEKSDTAKVDGTRPDPVPAVTPAPKETAKPAEVAMAHRRKTFRRDR
jgi:hypothetical protein